MESYLNMVREFTSLNEIAQYYSNLFENMDGFGKKELIDENIVLLFPRNRNYYLSGVNSNPFSAYAKVIWTLGGDKYIDPVMKVFEPDCINLSDDGKTLRGACNERLRKNNSLEHIVDMYKDYGLDTKRACCSIWRPDLDSSAIISDTLGTKTKDMPAQSFIWTWISNGMFHFKLGLSYLDLMGIYDSSIFVFTVMHELLYQYVRRDLNYSELKLGKYIHNPVSFCAYDCNLPQIHAVNNNSISDKVSECNDDEDNYLVQIPRTLGIYEFCGQMYSNFAYCTKRILEEEFDAYDILSQAKMFFQGAECETNGNTLYYYFILPLLYLDFGKLKTGNDVVNFLDFLKSNDINVSKDTARMLNVMYGSGINN